MLFVPNEGLYVGDIGGGRVLRIDVGTHAASTIATGFGAPNAFARDHHGNLFVSDSFPGTITKIAPDGTTTTFSYAAQLAPSAGEFPPFGANGLAFDRDGSHLYVAMTSRDQVFRIAYDGAALGAIELFATGGAGGNAFNSPASLVFAGRSVYVANLALFHGGPQKLSVFTAPYPGP